MGEVVGNLMGRFEWRTAQSRVIIIFAVYTTSSLIVSFGRDNDNIENALDEFHKGNDGGPKPYPGQTTQVTRPF